MYKVNDSLSERQRAKEKSDLIFLLATACVTALLTLILALNHFVYLGVRVEGRSMLPTLDPGDVLMVNRVKEFEKGSVIVISGEQKDWIIKRVIATEGSVVTFAADGFVYIDGEKYVDEYGYADFSDRVSVPFMEKTLSKDEIFYLGDNRSNSSDGRDYGTCTVSQVVGVVTEWSIDNKILNKIFFWV